MVDISRNYIDKTLRAFDSQQISEDAREYFLALIMNYADDLAEKSNAIMKNRKGKKLMKKDIKLASDLMM